jgi:transmembrane sensor
MPRSDALKRGVTRGDDPVIQQAAIWLVKLHAGEMDDADERALRKWRMQAPEHERAWQAADDLARTFGMVPAGIGVQTLEDARRIRRRTLVRSVALLTMATPATWLAWRVWGVELSADYRTAIGERRSYVLADGTRLLLNTGSAVDVVFDGQQRLVLLRTGEILLETGHPELSGRPVPPFFVQTAQGRVQALGTRFAVRTDESAERTRIVVLEHAVEIRSPTNSASGTFVQAGEQVDFTRDAIAAPRAVEPGATAWAQGAIVADRLRLEDFLAELSRYRPGVLRCAPEVAELRISGVFQAADTDSVLATLQQTLGVEVRMRTRYWVTVTARSVG